jgi:choice-of-anchor C domain-containing protein
MGFPELVLHHCHRQGGFLVKRRSGLGIALGVVASIAFAGSTLAAFTGLTNGSFEDVNSTYVDNGSGFQQLDAPNASIDGWTVAAGSVDWIGTYWPAPDGAMSIDMSGANAGALTQTFDTTIGNTYTVSFLLSGNPAGEPAVKTLDVSATGGTLVTYSHDTTGTDLTTMVWAPQTYEFLATSATTTLSFISTTATAFGPAIDSVAVTETLPEVDDCKDGGWQTMIDTAGNSFKNQGDCVSFFATKGKNLGAVPPATVPAAVDATDTGSVKKSAKQVTSTVKQAPKEKAKAATRQGDERQAKDKAKGQASSNKDKQSKKTK